MPQLTPQLIIFFTLAGIAVVTALGVLLSRSAVYSAILLVVNFTTVAFIYFILGAPFIGLAQITVYAGAIMVLFLFVIMMLGTENIAQYEPIGFQRIVTVFVGLIVIAEAVFMFLIKDPSTLLVTAGGSVVEVETIGMLLYQKYLLPFEITSFILLIAVVGAIVLNQTGKEEDLDQPGGGKTMNTIPMSYYLVLSAILFSLGAIGVITRRNPLVIFMSLELMFNAANITFVAFSNAFGKPDGQIFVFFVMVVAAAEVAVGLALMVAIFHTKRSIDIDLMNGLKN